MREDLLYRSGVGCNSNCLKKDEISNAKGIIIQKLNFLYDKSHKLCAAFTAKEPEITIEMIAKFLLNNHLCIENAYFKLIDNKLNEYEKEDRYEKDIYEIDQTEDMNQLIFLKLEYLIFILACIDRTLERNIRNMSEYSNEIYFQTEYLKILFNLILQIRKKYYSDYSSIFPEKEITEKGIEKIAENSDFNVFYKNSELATIVGKRVDLFSNPSFAEEIRQGFLRVENDRKNLLAENSFLRSRGL